MKDSTQGNRRLAAAGTRRLNWAAAAILCLTLGTAPSAVAGDWPQILGPNRNGIAQGETIAHNWGAAGPRRVWQYDLGSGLAGPAVVDGKLIIFHRVGNEDVAEALDARSGTPLWKVTFPTRYVSTISTDNGPRCVPTVHAGHVYLIGGGGQLHCVKLADGAKVWSRDCARDFNAPDGYFGFGSSPIVAADRLLVNVGGGSAEAGIVAFDLKTGRTLWQATGELASYSSPVTARIADKDQVVFVTRYQTLGIDPASGRVWWKLPFGQRGPTVNAANPLVLGDHLFLTASYGIGAVYARLGQNEPQEVWSSDNVLSSQYTTPIYRDGYLYGIDGRHDVGIASLRCIDPKTGKVVWNQDGFGKASLLLAGDKLLVQTTGGELRVVAASPEGYRLLASATVCGEGTFALAALSDGYYYVRDGERLRCFDLRGN